MSKTTFPLLVPLFAAACLTGCGGPSDLPELGEVSGVVTDGGAAVPNATLEFQPENGRPSMGRTDAEGRYVLNYTADYPGAKISQHQVRITPLAGPPPAAPDSTASGSTEPMILLPEPSKKKTKSGPLQMPELVTVEAGENTINFDLSEAGS